MVKRQFFAGFAEYNSHSLENTERERTTVAPHAGAWIETSTSSNGPNDSSSPPMRGRGLKLIPAWRLFIEMKAPPMRGRGLKLIDVWASVYYLGRPHAGAWIEQDGGGLGDGEVTSPPMRGVD